MFKVFEHVPSDLTKDHGWVFEWGAPRLLPRGAITSNMLSRSKTHGLYSYDNKHLSIFQFEVCVYIYIYMYIYIYIYIYMYICVYIYER